MKIHWELGEERMDGKGIRIVRRYVNWRRAPAICLYMGWSTSPHRG